MNCLQQYKQSLINLNKNSKQKKILENSFTRWYFNCKKLYIYPVENIVIQYDLEYANMYKLAEFNIENFMKKSEKIFSLFQKKLSSVLDEQTNFYNSTFYSSNINSIKQIEQLYGLDQSSNFEQPYKLPRLYKNITAKQLTRLYDLYIHKESDYDQYFYQITDNLIALYELIGINNIHLSIPPVFNGIELFGSPLNTHNKEYCSPFEIEKHYNSLGSFWDYKFHRNGIYLCNPPFDEVFINKMADKLIDDISNTEHKVLVIITIPLWDSISQNENDVKNFNLELKGLSTLLKSNYLKDHTILDKEKYPYWNYYTEKYIYASWTHLIILSNLNNIFYKKNININNFLDRWEKFKPL